MKELRSRLVWSIFTLFFWELLSGATKLMWLLTGSYMLGLVVALALTYLPEWGKK